MSAIESFNFEVGATPKVLVLGSIPGIASLEQQQYYAHPRNAFWLIVSEYFLFSENKHEGNSYQDQLSLLLNHHVALWDVLQRCERSGSLDSAIKKDTIVPNDIPSLLKHYPAIQALLFNGAKAASEFGRHFKEHEAVQGKKLINLPSTSPAYATMSLDEKKRHWFAALDSIEF